MTQATKTSRKDQHTLGKVIKSEGSRVLEKVKEESLNEDPSRQETELVWESIHPMNLGVIPKSFPYVGSSDSKVRETWKPVTRNSVNLTAKGGARQGNTKKPMQWNQTVGLA